MAGLIRTGVNKLRKLSHVRYILLFAAGVIVFQFLFGLVVLAIEHVFDMQVVINSTFSRHGFWYKLLVGCLLGPLFETYVFQHLPYQYLKSKRVNTIIIVIVSSILFGIVHYYSWVYVLRAALVGVIFISAYILKPASTSSALVTVSIIHALNNLFVLVAETIT